MKTKIFLLFIIIPFLTQATVWRVDGATNLDADFSSIQNALANASNGDTIYVSPNGGASYGSVTLTKSLTIIGTGYFLNDNDSNHYYGSPARLDVVLFEEGSANSILKGFEFVGSLSEYNTSSGDELNNVSVVFNTCCILLEKCRGNSGGIGYTLNGDNCIISKCFFPGLMVEFERVTISLNPSFEGTGILGSMISNSVIGNFSSAQNSNIESILSLQVDRCLFFRTSGLSINAVNTVFTNCIFLQSGDSNYDTGGSTFFNCVDVNDGIGSGLNNQTNIDQGTLFNLALASHPELRYSLSETSPARNAATDGGDIGIFGGPDPYVLSGMPDIPSIFQLSVDPAGDGSTQSIGVNLKAKSHD